MQICELCVEDNGAEASSFIGDIQGGRVTAPLLSGSMCGLDNVGAHVGCYRQF